MISPGSASFTRMAAICANCWLNCAVKLTGMCCTSSTAPGKSLGNEGTNFINVAGPPVEAATITIGNLPPDLPALALPAEKVGGDLTAPASAGRELLAERA